MDERDGKESASTDGHELSTADITSQRVGRIENELLLNETSSDSQVKYIYTCLHRITNLVFGLCLRTRFVYCHKYLSPCYNYYTFHHRGA